jgi:hypothetical protein
LKAKKVIIKISTSTTTKTCGERKEFLLYSGALFLGLLGISSILKLILEHSLLL